MKATVTKTFYFNSKQIKEIMQDAGYEDNEWEDEDEVETFLFSADSMDLEDYCGNEETDVDVED